MVVKKSIKKSMISLFVIVSLMMGATSASAAVFETEPNDSFETANPVSIGDMIIGTMYEAWEPDFFTFTAQYDQVINFSIEYSGASWSSAQFAMVIFSIDGGPSAALNSQYGYYTSGTIQLLAGHTYGVMVTGGVLFPGYHYTATLY